MKTIIIALFAFLGVGDEASDTVTKPHLHMVIFGPVVDFGDRLTNYVMLDDVTYKINNSARLFHDNSNR